MVETVTYSNGDTYTGDFVDSTFHGKGTYTYTDGTTYTGDYVDGARTGQGTYTYTDGTTYTGDYLENKWHGQGTYTSASGSEYIGDFVDSTFHGKGTYTYADGTTYTGDYLDGVFSGQGTQTYAGGTKYVGDFVDGARTGQGNFTYAIDSEYVFTYVGDFVDNARTGQGVKTWASGATYTGDWVDDVYSGQGTYTSASGSTYTGDYVDGARTGQGTYTYASGSEYVGDFVDNKWHGQGTYTYTDGTTYTGDFVDNKWHGQGTYTSASGTKYVGDYVDDARTGQGTYTYADGTTYTGDFVDSIFHGQGTHTYTDGDTYTGDYVDGAKTGQGTYTWVSGDTFTGDFVDGVRQAGVFDLLSGHDVELVKTGINYDTASEYQKLLTEFAYNYPNKVIPYSFISESSNFPESYEEKITAETTIINLPDSVKENIRGALRTIEQYIDISFQEIDDTLDFSIDPFASMGEMRFGAILREDSWLENAAAFTQKPSNTTTDGPHIWANWDEKWSDNVTYSDPENYGFYIFLHEIGHTLGLKHPFDPRGDEGSTSYANSVVKPELDNWQNTLMSYTSISNLEDLESANYLATNSTTGTTYEAYYPTTLMGFDVLALQEIFGASTDANLGDDIYKFDNDTPAWQAIYDVGGVDVLDLSGITAGATIDLRTNGLSKIGAEDLFKGASDSDLSTGALWCISGTELENVLLPTSSGENVYLQLGAYDCVVTKPISGANFEITTSNRGSLILDLQGQGNTVTKLNNSSQNWEEGFVALHVGSPDNIGHQFSVPLIDKLRHEVSIKSASSESSSLIGTDLGDAVFLSDLVWEPSANWISLNPVGTERLLGIDIYDLKEGNDLLDLTSSKTSLKDEFLNINMGTGDDLLWLNDGTYQIDLGSGNDNVVTLGGDIEIILGTGKDVVSLTGSKANIVITDYNKAEGDSLKFISSADVANNFDASFVGGDILWGEVTIDFLGLDVTEDDIIITEWIV